MTGVSGAGLINLIWMRPGSKVIDIRPRDKTLNGLFVMADIFNINYEYYWCEDKNFISNAPK